MAWALRHAPAEAGIILDAHGWTSVSDLLHSLYQRHLAINAVELAEIVASDDKGRFSLSDDHARIRANYAHSTTVDLGLPARKPPSPLFHGTARRYLDAIKRDGILRQQRQFVHLVADLLMAFAIGRRHGDPVAITVASQAMYEDGLRFYHGAGAIWMTEVVPARYLCYDRLYYPSA
jgi:putative RNA 2'-phosphotransferase